jgi:gamma-glutamylcyclotransferase (GGCT)/AIG2-like uncharacterized protein YtfP
MLHLFTYGTLMFPEVWRVVVGKDFESTPAQLPGYQIFRVRDAVYPGIIATEPSGSDPISESPRAEMGLNPSLISGSRPSTLDPRLCTVPGLLYLNLDATSIKRLDAFEDDFYRRQTITVITEDGQQLETQAYVVPPESWHVLTDERWTGEDFEARGHLAEFVARYSGFGRL